MVILVGVPCTFENNTYSSAVGVVSYKCQLGQIDWLCCLNLLQLQWFLSSDLVNYEEY